MIRPIIILLTLHFHASLFAQKNGDEFKKIILDNKQVVKEDLIGNFVNYDITPLLIQTPNSRVLGFLGDTYQRIRIKLVSIIKDKENPKQYFVYGKSLVKDNICEFQGVMSIQSVFLLKSPEHSDTKQGQIVGEYLFYENPRQKHSGMFKGVFVTTWYFDKNGNLKYNDLSSVSDSFTNNQFVGIWTSYSTETIKICNWGDNRIPMSGDLDDGVGEFHPSTKYQLNGWSTYNQAYSGGYDKEKEAVAKQIEDAEWWK